MYTYYLFFANKIKNSEQLAIINFIYILTNYCFYLNNVKPFYVSILTSRLFRQTFIKSLMKLLPRYLRQRWHVSQAHASIMTAVRVNQQQRILP